MKLKREFVITMAACRAGEVLFYDWAKDGGKRLRDRMSYDNRFATVLEAKEKLRELQCEEGIYIDSCNTFTIDALTEEATDMHIRNALRSLPLGSKAVFIARVPDVWYLGEYWKKVLDTKGLGFYTNEKNCYLGYGKQCVKSYDLDEGTIVFCSKTAEALFFSPETAMQMKEVLKKVWGEPLSVRKMPIHLPYPPKYTKWDKVYVFNEGRRITCHTVMDVVPDNIEEYPYDGRTPGLQYTYEISNSPFGFRFPMESDLHTWEDLEKLGVETTGKNTARYKGNNWTIEEG